MILAKKTPIKFLLMTAKKEMFLTIAFTIALFLIHHKFSFFSMPIAISALLGTSIALILSFRLAQSYDRWWEARMIWGSIVNDSRSLILQVLNFSNHVEKEQAKKIAKLQIAWVDTLAHTLRKEPVDKAYLDSYVDKAYHTEILKAFHPSLEISNIMSAEIERIGSIDSYKKVQIDSTLVRLVDSMGRAERIKNTVFPTEYPLYLHLTIYLFLAFMSVSLANLGHHWEILFILFIAAPFFLLEKAAEHLQDPFENRPTDVPISSISRTIEINILSLLKEKDIPSPLEVKDFYIN